MSATTPFAVLLNTNARHVSLRSLDQVGEFVDPEHVFLSESPEQADSMTASILERDYQTVFTAGGDGTVTRFINNMSHRNDSPRIGILRMGTGNAMAEIVSSGNALADLRTFVANPSRDTYHLPLCQAEGTQFAYAGLGLDAALLHDYRSLKQRCGRFGRPIHNMAGYLAAALGITIPRLIARRFKRRDQIVRVTSLGTYANRIAAGPTGGSVVESFGPGTVLYEGPMRAVMFGTCPFYGYGLKALPFAGVDPTRFHLRVSNVSAARVALGMHKVWKGNFTHPQLYDFHVGRVRLEFSEPVPYQLAGEVMGTRQVLEVGLADRAVNLVRFI